MAKKQQAIVSALIAFGLVLFVFAAVSGGGNTDDISVTNNPAIDALIPARESEILRGDQIGIDLAEGFSAALQINTSDDREIQVPANQLDENFKDNLGQFTFRPGVGKVLDALPPQSNCVIATYWPVTDPDAAATITWCFNVT
jgi:hypothetical protein